MRGRAPGIELERRAVVGTDAAIRREQRLHPRECGGSRASIGPARSARRSRQRLADRPSRSAAPRRSVELVGGQHGRTPSVDQRTGSRRMPERTRRLRAAADRRRPRKNMQPPAPEPAAFPPSAPACACRSRRAISGVHMPGSSPCCSRQFSLAAARRRQIARAGAPRPSAPRSPSAPWSAPSPRGRRARTPHDARIVPPEKREPPV